MVFLLNIPLLVYSQLPFNSIFSNISDARQCFQVGLLWVYIELFVGILFGIFLLTTFRWIRQTKETQDNLSIRIEILKTVVAFFVVVLSMFFDEVIRTFDFADKVSVIPLILTFSVMYKG